MKRVYSLPVRICHIKQNRMDSENLAIFSLLAVLKLKIKDCLEYKAERNLAEIVQFDLK